MWHAFEMMDGQAGVAEELHAATAEPACTLVYRDRILARFPTKDKVGTTRQWRPAVEAKPGLTLTREPAADGAWKLGVEQAWEFAGVTHRLLGQIAFSAGALPQPTRWNAEQSLSPNPEFGAMTPVGQDGTWENGTFRQTLKAGAGVVPATQPCAALTAVYGLLASFPAQDVDRAELTFGLLLEGFVFCPAATLAKGLESNREQPLARGLRNYSLRFGGGLPLEFWVNAGGVVLYVCQGPTRLLELASAEKSK